MLLYTPEGPRSIDDRDVLHVYRGGGDGRYTHCTLFLLSGIEISGAAPNDALAALDARLADDAPPPMAA
jgi:hypothetical protein